MGGSMPDIPNHLVNLRGGFKAFLSPPPEGVVRLTVGEPAFDTPKNISDAAIKAIRDGDTHYTRGEGTEELCNAWASHLRTCLLYTSPSPRDQRGSRMPSSA